MENATFSALKTFAEKDDWDRLSDFSSVSRRIIKGRALCVDLKSRILLNEKRSYVIARRNVIFYRCL